MLCVSLRRAQLNYSSGQYAVDVTVILGVNARSLSIEKADELLSVSSRNDVSCVCVMETWFKEFMSDESVGL